MMTINSDGTVDNFTLILSKANHEHLGELTNFEDLDCKLRMNSYDELSFTLYKYVNDKKTPLWNETRDLRLVYVKELNEYFQIKVPLSESKSTYKSVTAISQCEAELSQTNVTLEINSEDDIARNDYDVNFPTVFCRDIDDISAYNDIWNSDEKYKSYSENDKRNVLKNSSFMHRILYKNPNYSIGHIDDSLKGLIRTFSVSDEPLYDFLSGEVSEQFNCIFKYDSVTRTISAYDLSTVCKDCGNRGEYTDICPKCGSHNLKYYGEDTTIYVSVDNLTEEINYETDVDSIKNTFRLSAGDEDMTTQVILCNPGGEYMYYIHPELMGDMSENLQNRLKEYTELSNEKEQQYQEYVELWETAIDQKYYLEHTMMPSSSDIENGTATVSASTEAEKITSDNLSPLAVTSLKESTKAVTISNALLNYVKVYVKTGYVKVDVVEDSDTFAYDKTNNTGIWKGKFRVQNYSDEEDTVETDEITVNVNTDEQTFMNQKVIKAIAQYADDDHSVFDVLGITDFNEFKNALKQYSLNRLKSFSNSFYAVLDILKQDGTAVEDSMYYSDLYLPYYQKYNACNDEMDARQASIDEQDAVISENETNMKEITNELNFSKFLGDDLYKEFCSFRREDKYENQNYISDGLETPEIIANAKKFLEQAKKEIVKFGTPQHSISSNLYNLLLIPAFKPIIDKFELGNWLRFQVDDEIYRLRLIECEFNFSDISKINVEFSTVTKTADGYNDIQSILSSASSLSSTISIVQKQAEKGENANNQIINAVQNGLDSGLMMIKSNDREEFVTNQYGIIGRSYDDTLGEYSPEELYITHNIIGFSKDSGQTLSLALGKHEYTYYDIFSNSFKTEVSYGLTSDFVQSGKIWGSDIIAGQIYSKNYSKGIKGTHFDLDNGNFELAGSKIVYDSATNKITMREVTIEWDSTTPPQISDISGLEEELNGIQNNLDQLDGRIQTYSQTNDPSVDWVTTELKNQHSGDIWVNPSDGLTKQWNGTKWIVVTDSYLKSLASSKAQIFTVKPTVAYFKGDMLIPVESFTVSGVTYKQEKAYRALKDSNSNTFNNSDWDALDYTNDDYIINFINGDYAKTIETIKSQVDGKARAWYMSTDPSNVSTNPDWDTSEDHEGDLWYNTSDSSNVTSIYKDGKWQPTNVPKAVFDTIDGKRQIFVRKPSSTSKYMSGDLWVISESDCTNGKITVNGTTFEVNSTLVAVLPDSVKERTGYTEIDWHDISTHDGIVALDQSTQALNKFDDIASDTKITPTEKQQLKVMFENIKAEKVSIINNCREYSMDSSSSKYYSDYNSYLAAYTSLETLFNSILSNITTTIDVPSNYSSVTKEYYDKYDIINTDIQKASKDYSNYTLTNWVNGDYKETLQNIKTQIDGKSNCTYGGSTPPSNPETGDLWFCTDGSNGYGVNKAYMYNGTSWKESNGVPDSVWDIADGKSSIFIVKPENSLSDVDSHCYYKGDIWILESDIELNGITYKAGSILTSTSDSTSFIASHWIEKVRYTDDTKANSVETAINTFQTNVNKLLNASISTTEIGKDYVFSPYIGGGYLYIKNASDERSVTIDPQQTYSSDGYIFRITDKTGNTTIGADSNGNATFTGNIIAKSLDLSGCSNKVSTDYISGLSEVATSGKATDLSGLSNVATSGKASDLTDISNYVTTSGLSTTLGKYLTTDSAKKTYVANTSVIISDPVTDSKTGITTQKITVGDKTFDYVDSGDFICTNIGIGKGSTPSDTSTSTDTYVMIDKDGCLTADNAVIRGTIYATNGYFSGDIKSGSTITCGDNFSVTKDGCLTADNAAIRGTINATSGYIGEWEIGDNRIGINPDDDANFCGFRAYYSDSQRRAHVVGDSCEIAGIIFHVDYDNKKVDIYNGSGQQYLFESSLGTSTLPWTTIYGKTIYENGTALSDKYIPIVENHPVVRSYGNETSNYIINEITHVYDGSSNNYMQFNTSKNAFGITAWVSDTKLKKNIIQTDIIALDKINQINMVQFDWKIGGHVNLGISANQLEEIIPDAVFEVSQSKESEYDTLKNIDPNIIIPYCLKAIQELSCEIDKLTTQLGELNKQTEN